MDLLWHCCFLSFFFFSLLSVFFSLANLPFFLVLLVLLVLEQKDFENVLDALKVIFVRALLTFSSRQKRRHLHQWFGRVQRCSPSQSEKLILSSLNLSFALLTSFWMKGLPVGIFVQHRSWNFLYSDSRVRSSAEEILWSVFNRSQSMLEIGRCTSRRSGRESIFTWLYPEPLLLREGDMGNDPTIRMTSSYGYVWNEDVVSGAAAEMKRRRTKVK